MSTENRPYLDLPAPKEPPKPRIGTLELECELVIKALRVNTLSKLTFDDSKKFIDLCADVFPGIPASDTRYPDLEVKIKEVLKERPNSAEANHYLGRAMLLAKDSIADAFEKVFQIWQTSTQVTNVMGFGPVPTFAPPVVPMGPVVGGLGAMLPGGLV